MKPFPPILGKQGFPAWTAAEDANSRGAVTDQNLYRALTNFEKRDRLTVPGAPDGCS